MDFGWFLLGFIGVVLVLAFLHVVSEMVNEREAAARRRRSRRVSLSGDTITFSGRS